MINCLPSHYAPPWDPELECLREQLRRAQIEDEKRRLRREIERLRPCPWVFTPGIWQPYCPSTTIPMAPSIQDVLGAIPAR